MTKRDEGKRIHQKGHSLLINKIPLCNCLKINTGGTRYMR
jgi:hypothetical protein